MKTLCKIFITTVVTLTLTQTLCAQQLEGEALRKNITEKLPALNHAKLEALMQRIGKKVPKNLYNCLCKQDGGGAAMGVSVSYHPQFLEPYSDKYSCNHEGAPCMASGMGCWRFPLPSDSKIWNYCTQQNKYEDNSTIIDAIINEVKGLHQEQKLDVTKDLSSEQNATYKKICDEAILMFPLAHQKYLNNQTKILWDEKMLKASFDDAVKLYEKESNKSLSVNTNFWHANSYLPWLFGHGMNTFGGPLIDAKDAKRVSDIVTEESALEVLKYQLKTKEKDFSQLPGSQQSDIREMEKFWKEVETLKKEITKQEDALKYSKFLKNREGYEPGLLQGILEYQKRVERKLTPGDVLYLSLQQRNGKLNEALLLAHNTLRAIARPGEGDFAVTGVDGDAKLYKSIFVELREGDNAGPWYHLFGTGFYNVQQKTENLLIPSGIGSVGTNTLEQFYRELIDKRIPDPEKFCFNAWGAEVSGELFNEYINKNKSNLSSSSLEKK